MKTKNLSLIVCLSLILYHFSYSQNAGVPISEYNSLVKLYNESVGPIWHNNTNWLDTTNYSVADWYGITVENGHVTQIELSDNNLQEGVFEYPILLPELTILDLTGNNLDNINFYSLDSLSNLNELHIENNNLVFQDIIVAFNLPYYSNFSSNFTYSPQAKIDYEEEIVLNPGDILEMEINPYFISVGDQIQWYKDGTPLSGENNNYYDKTNITIEDSGNYYVEVTNPNVPNLKLISNVKNVTVIDFVGGIPRKEYEALVALYYAMDGDNWNINTNWLDTLNHSVGDWHGITVNDGHVIGIYLQNIYTQGTIPSELGNLSYLTLLNLRNCTLSGAIPKELGNLKQLSILDLSFNQLGPKFIDGIADPERCIPNELENIDSLTYFNIDQNMLMFNDIEAVFSWNNFENFQFVYRAQYPLNYNYGDVWVEPNENYTLTINNYLPGLSDQYQWYKNGNPITGADTLTLVLKNVQLSDEGNYYCVITNSVATDTKIHCFSTLLKVNDIHGAGVPVSEYLALETFYNLNNGSNWQWNTNWLDTITCTVNEWDGVLTRDGHVIFLGMDSSNVAGILPEELKNLTYLEKLYLFDNGISGNIPEWIGELVSLKALDLAKNNLTGIIPVSIGALNNLETLRLSENQLSGDIPVEIGNLNELKHLDLSNNNLTGKIPNSIGNLTNLWTLNLSNNQLVGPLPIELANLTNIYRFDIDNNLIGSIDLNKSVTIGNNRQIPDELSELIQIDTLYLGGNNLQFNDIEAIFNWDNYTDFEAFVYYPQDFIGSSKSIEKLEGEDVVLSIDNYYAGPSDKYQWYKNGTLLSGKTNSSLTLNNLQLSDADNYYCKVTNSVATELTLTSRNIKLNITKRALVAGVPRDEYEALVTLYNEMDGDNWEINTNWLDTSNSSIDDWYGITVTDEHITHIILDKNNLANKIPTTIEKITELQYIDLSENNIEGPLPNEMGNLSKLEYLNLSANLIGKIPDDNSTRVARQIPDEIGNINSLRRLILSGNYIQPNDIEAVYSWPNYNGLTEFSYIFQIGLNKEKTIIVDQGTDVSITLDYYFPGNHDKFQWYKNNEYIPGANSQSLELKDVDLTDEGTYHCSINNTLATSYSILDNRTILTVNGIHGAGVPVSEYKALEAFYNLNNGDDWQWNTNWLDTINCTVDEWDGVWTRDGHVIFLGMDSSNVLAILPEILTNLVYLEDLNLFNNNISGEIPSWIGDFKNLKNLYLAYNNLTGEIPVSIGDLKNLQYLWLSNNQLSGSIPGVIGNLTELQHFELSHNQFSGTIPISIGSLHKLTKLDLEYNELTGKVPSTIGNLTSLRYIDLSNNQLVGPLPVELENLSNIYKFDIGNNLIGNTDFNKSGNLDNNRQIPDELANLIQMDTLYLGGNSLQFNDIEAIFSWDNYADFNDFIYFPQDSIGISKAIEVVEGDTIVLNIENYFPGPSDVYQWYKGNYFIPGATYSEFWLSDIKLSDTGEYYCEIKNPVATELTLTSRKIYIDVSKSVGMESTKITGLEIYPNPAQQRIFVDTRNTNVNMEILDITGQTILTRNDFRSDWINIESFSPGIYLFKIQTQKQENISKKIIIK